MTTSAQTKSTKVSYKKVILISILAVLFAFGSVFVFVRSYHIKNKEYHEKLELLAQIEEDNRKLSAENARLQQQVDYLKTQSGVESVAREKLGFVKPEEIAFVVVPDDSANKNKKPSQMSREGQSSSDVSGKENKKNWFFRFWDNLLGR